MKIKVVYRDIYLLIHNVPYLQHAIFAILQLKHALHVFQSSSAQRSAAQMKIEIREK